MFAIVVLLAAGPGSDFVGTISTEGAPSFAQFAKGGNHERIVKPEYSPIVSEENN